MRLKRSKDYKRYMNMYCQTFHFRKPFQVLVDADFIQSALDQRIDLRTQIPKVLCDASKQMVSPCTMALLKSRGDDASGAFLASKRFEKRRCKHQTAVDESLCLAQIIGSSNPHNYVVASQSKKLRSQFAQIPGVPLLYINRSNLILEPPSEASLNRSKNIESAKTHASTKELQTLKAVKVTTAGKVSVDSGLVKKLEKKQENKKLKRDLIKAKIKKRLGPKEPNPLSVKKKKKVAETTKPKTATTMTATTASAAQAGATEGDENKEKKKTRRSKKSKSKDTSAAAGGDESS
ncbi:hypothetical protein BGZ83_006474 [Gryganskiella cystojenkinii]|nr:hypothetical protein BGZ83_006474 [Gryganskiella cystojenkinii]